MLGHPSGPSDVVFQLAMGHLVDVNRSRHFNNCTLLPRDSRNSCATHANAWIDYWEQSFVYIPDSPITMFHWYMSHYLLRISSYGTAAPGLFGPFVTDDEVLWSGDITLNYNAEAVYYDAAAANHMEVFEPYFQAVLDFLPAAARMAQELYPNCPDALVFPAHILPNGVQAHGVGRGDLGQKQMGLFAAVPFILYWRYSGNLAFAQRVLPFLSGVARFWECNLMEGADGYLHDAEDCAEEICLPDGDLQPDPTVVLSLLPSFFEAVAEVPLSVTGRKLQRSISTKLLSKPGSRISVQHGSRPLSLDQTLRQQGLVGECITLSYVYIPVDMLAAWKYLIGKPAEDEEFSLHGLTRIGGIEKLWQILLLPGSLQQLELGEEFNESLPQVKLPDSIKTIIFGFKFDQSLDRMTLPAGLQTLTFGNDFNQSLDGVTLPAGLQTLTLGNDFDQSLESVTLPAGLQTLILGSSFDQSLEGVTLPAGLQTLTFGNGFDQSLKGATLPAGLQTLIFGNDFNQSLEGVTLPAGLQTLAFGNDFDQSLEGVTLPAGLQILVFEGHLDNNLEDVTLPADLKSLIFGDWFNQSLDGVTLPAGLQELTFGNDFDQSLDGVTLPAGLQTLTFGGCFDQSLEGVTLPAGLKTLTLGYNFDQSLEGVTLPAGLKNLIFGDGFNRSLDGVTLPAGLQTLTLGNDFDQNLEGVTLPAGLQTLIFGNNFDQSLEGVTLPAGLQTLTFGNDFDQSLEGVTLPAGLQTLTFGNNFDQSLEGVTLPAGLQTLTFGNDFDRNLEGVNLPAGLQTLTFGNNFDRSLEGVTLPAGLQTLTFGNDFDQSLDGVTLPADLQTLTLGNCQELFEGKDTAYQPLWYWAALCSLTAPELGPNSKLQPVREEQQKKLLCLYHEPIELQLPVDPLKVEELLRCWILNCFEHSEDPEGYSAYFISSFMSHSCKPNAIWHEGSDAMHVVRARLDIQEGEEICISYLSEDMLLYSALQRKKALRKTKLFTCTCERCAGSNGAPGTDWCRGFRWQLRDFSVHWQFASRGFSSSALQHLPALLRGLCRRPDTEKYMRQRLQSVDEASFLQLAEGDVRQLQEMMGDQAGGALGPQHWLCERLWTLVVPWLDAKGRSTEALQMLEGRVSCQREMFPWPNATRAWTMQKYCRLLLRHYKSTSQEKGRLPVKKDSPRRMLARALTLQEEALRLLMLLFGDEHRYAARAKKKLRRLRTLADKARPAASSSANSCGGAARLEGAMARILLTNIGHFNREHMLDVTGAASAPHLSAVRLQQRARQVAPYATEELPGFGAPVVADFYGGETRHGRELRLHSGGSVAWGGLFAAFPLGTVHRRSSKEDVELVHRSLVRFFQQWPGGKQGNSFPHLFAAAARVGAMDGLMEVWEAYLTNTSDPKCRFYSNGMVLGCGSTGLENVGGAAFATEMMLSTAGGILEVFPSLPFATAAFQLRAPGPLLVTAQRHQGVVMEILLELPSSHSSGLSGPSVVRTDETSLPSGTPQWWPLRTGSCNPLGPSLKWWWMATCNL
eukprot:s2023_g9.t2